MEKKRGISEKRDIIYAVIFAVFFSVAMIFGAQLEQQGNVRFTSAGTWVGIAILFVCSAPAVWGLFYLMRLYDKRSGACKPFDASRKQSTEFWMFTVLLLLCWLPYFLSSYPGYFLYDAQIELNMILTAEYSTHHPLAHVLLVGGVVKIVQKITGSYNAGIAVYVVCQAVFAAMCFSFLFCRMKRWGVQRWILVIGRIYVCIFPVVPMYVLCTTKDVLFTLFLLLFLVNVIELAEFHIGRCIALILNGTMMLLMRKNGVYALVLAIPFLIVAVRSERKKMTFSLLAVLAAYLVCSLGLKGLTNADDHEKQEILTIPIQQLARVYNYEREAFSEEQAEALYQFLTEEALLKYRAVLSDPVKVAFNSQSYEEESGTFWKLWFQMGAKKPASYLNAFLANNCGFWYPYASLNCYQGNQVNTFVYEDSSYFGYETEPPGERRSLLPALDRFVRRLSLEISWQRIPGIRVLFHPAWYFWIFFFGIEEHLLRRRYRRVIYALPVCLLFLTVLLGPAVLVRYVLQFYFGFPLLLAFLFAGRKDDCREDYETG